MQRNSTQRSIVAYYGSTSAFLGLLPLLESLNVYHLAENDDERNSKLIPIPFRKQKEKCYSGYYDKTLGPKKKSENYSFCIVMSDFSYRLECRLQDHGGLSVVHRSKHLPYRRKIMVGCQMCRYPSIHLSLVLTLS